jgi:nitrite reductase (NADH) small subunit
MSNWVLIAAASDCPPGTAKELVAKDRIIALFNVEGNFHALDGVCPHQGGPLGQGTLTGCIVTCPWHGWQFNVTTGQHQTSQSLVHPSFPVKVEGNDIYVDIPDE